MHRFDLQFVQRASLVHTVASSIQCGNHFGAAQAWSPLQAATNKAPYIIPSYHTAVGLFEGAPAKLLLCLLDSFRR